MAKTIKFAVTVNEETFPELYEELVQIPYGRGRSERIKLIATDFLKGRFKSFSIQDLQALMAQNLGLPSAPEKPEEENEILRESFKNASDLLMDDLDGFELGR